MTLASLALMREQEEAEEEPVADVHDSTKSHGISLFKVDHMIKNAVMAAQVAAAAAGGENLKAPVGCNMVNGEEFLTNGVSIEVAAGECYLEPHELLRQQAEEDRDTYTSINEVESCYDGREQFPEIPDWPSTRCNHRKPTPTASMLPPIAEASPRLENGSGEVYSSCSDNVDEYEKTCCQVGSQRKGLGLDPVTAAPDATDATEPKDKADVVEVLNYVMQEMADFSHRMDMVERKVIASNCETARTRTTVQEQLRDLVNQQDEQRKMLANVFAEALSLERESRFKDILELHKVIGSSPLDRPDRTMSDIVQDTTAIKKAMNLLPESSTTNNLEKIQDTLQESFNESTLALAREMCSASGGMSFPGYSVTAAEDFPESKDKFHTPSTETGETQDLADEWQEHTSSEQDYSEQRANLLGCATNMNSELQRCEEVFKDLSDLREKLSRDMKRAQVAYTSAQLGIFRESHSSPTSSESEVLSNSKASRCDALDMTSSSSSLPPAIAHTPPAAPPAMGFATGSATGSTSAPPAALAVSHATIPCTAPGTAPAMSQFTAPASTPAVSVSAPSILQIQRHVGSPSQRLSFGTPSGTSEADPNNSKRLSWPLPPRAPTVLRCGSATPPIKHMPSAAHVRPGGPPMDVTRRSLTSAVHKPATPLPANRRDSTGC